MATESVDKHPFRTLFVFLALGAGIFVIGFFLVLLAVTVYGGLNIDPSVLGFYPWIAGAGGLFGFERWWAYESGVVNPFHDR